MVSHGPPEHPETAAVAAWVLVIQGSLARKGCRQIRKLVSGCGWLVAVERAREALAAEGCWVTGKKLTSLGLGGSFNTGRSDSQFSGPIRPLYCKTALPFIKGVS